MPPHAIPSALPAIADTYLELLLRKRFITESKHHQPRKVNRHETAYPSHATIVYVPHAGQICTAGFTDVNETVKICTTQSHHLDGS
jgi:hypothetical protein